jgi:hypothetical protein
MALPDRWQIRASLAYAWATRNGKPESAMDHVPLGAIIAIVVGLVVAFVLVFAGIRSRKNKDA